MESQIMKIGKDLAVIALLGILPTTLVWAKPQYRTTFAVQQTVTDEDGAAAKQEATAKEAPKSPSDLTVTDEEVESAATSQGPVEPPQPPPDATASGVEIQTAVSDWCGVPATSCRGYCPERACCLCDLYCLGDPWKLPQPCALQRLGIGIGGWIQHGITFNSRNPADNLNGPVALNDMAGQYQLNQAWMFLHRPADNGGCGWAIGGHLDAMYGTDARFGANFGLEDNINGLSDYGIVIPQAYLEVAYNRLSVKLGHFAGILDYELVPGPPNPFYSHSYSYGYTVPQLVTGMLADYKMTDRLSAQAGFHRGWMMFEDNNGSLDVMAGVKWTTWDERSSLAYAFSSGPQDPAGDQDRYVSSLVLQHQLTEQFKYVLVHNLGFQNGAPGGADAEWYGLNQYFLYTINPRLSANVRYEIMRDDDGAIIAGPGNIGLPAWAGRGFAGNFYELTAGLTWRPHANVSFRPELRYDWYNGQRGFIGADANQLPFDSGTADNQFTFAVDMVVTF